jgi:subtilase family serine protease
MFWTKVQMPHTGNLELASARRCKEKESYISKAIIEYNNLFQYMTTDKTIRLTWHALSCSTSKARSTRFKIVPDVDIEYNMVVGTGCYDPDENDLDVPTRELEQGLELGGENCTLVLQETC